MDSDSTGHLFSWIKDALFSKQISPSKKYMAEQRFAQDDTNYRGRMASTSRHVRSNSLDGLTESFYQRYDLLHEENGYSNNLMSPVRLHPRANATDTFQRDSRSNRINYNSPKKGDPILNRLFATHDRHIPKAPGPAPVPVRSAASVAAASAQDNRFPGKFPSPAKVWDSPRVPQSSSRTRDYELILDQLDQNNKSLATINEDFERQKYEYQLQENYYKKNYDLIKNDYVVSLKDSQKILDKSIRLNQLNQRLSQDLEKTEYNYKTDKDFLLQQIDILKTELLETKLIQKEEINNLADKFNRLQSDYNNLLVENNNIRYNSGMRQQPYMESRY